MKCHSTLLVLLAIFLLSSLAFANDSPPLQPSTPLLRALESASQVQVPLSMPQPMWKTCNANQFCPVSGCPIACNGQNTCTVETTSVTCDGNVTNCPSCPTPPPGCVSECDWCYCRAAGFTQFQCRGYCFL